MTQQDILKLYHDKIKEIQTYTRAGEFSIPKEQISAILNNEDAELRKSIVEQIKFSLEDARLYGEKTTELNGIRDYFSISYKRNTLWDKLTRSKRFFEITLTGNTEDILRKFGRIGQDILKRRIDLLGWKIYDFRKQIQQDARKKRDKERDEERKKRFKDTPFQDSSDHEKAAINPAHICLVHATKYFPKKNKDGQYEIETLATATHLRYPRNTIHFALNHLVESHLYGNWDDMPYVILAPLDKTSEINNRNPAGVSLVDTFFEMDLNENLKLPPEAFLIYPAPKNEKWREGQTYKIGKHHAIYKADDSSALKNKQQLVRTVLEQHGYKNSGWGRSDTGPESDVNHKCMRMGKKLGAIASNGFVLHAATILGSNGIEEFMSISSPSVVTTLSEFIHIASSPSSKIEKIEKEIVPNFFSISYKATTQNAEIKVSDDLLKYIYQKDFWDKVCQRWDAVITNYKKNKKEYLLTERTKHVFEAWKEKQDKIWSEDLPKFLEKYPTLKAFEKAARKTTESKTETSLAQKAIQAKQTR